MNLSVCVEPCRVCAYECDLGSPTEERGGLFCERNRTHWRHEKEFRSKLLLLLLLLLFRVVQGCSGLLSVLVLVS